MHIVSSAGCAAGVNVCQTSLLPWDCSGLWAQKGTGDVIHVLVHWIWNLEGLGVAAALNL